MTSPGPLARIASERIAGRSYAITRDEAGALVCDCPAFSFSTASPRTCKHIAQFEIADLAAPNAIPLHTFTGRPVFPLAPQWADICLADIAHALSMQSRFAGHLREFYSVAQHSVLVSELCDPEDARHGLLHDASEAYLMDIPRPIKHLPMMDGYRRAEAVLQAAIYRRFGLRATMPASVKTADDAVLANEAQDLFVVVPAWARERSRAAIAVIEPWPPAEAERAFLARFRALRRQDRDTK